MPSLKKSLILLVTFLIMGAGAIFLGLKTTDTMLHQELVRDAKGAAARWAKYVYSAEPKLVEVFANKSVQSGVSDVFMRTYPGVRTVYYELYDSDRKAFFISYMNVKIDFKKLPDIDKIIDKPESTKPAQVKVAFHSDDVDNQVQNYATVAVPYFASGKLFGYIVSYIDQTDQRAALVQSFGRVAILILSIFAVSIFGPIVMFVLKIRDKRRASEALHESEELFSKAFRASPASMTLSYPKDGSHLDVNEKWSEMLGYSREDAMAHSAVELGIWVAPELRDKFIEKLKTYNSVRSFAAKFRAKDGQELDCLLSGEYFDVGGEPRLLIVSEDITERKKTEATNRRLARILEDSINEIFIFDAETLKFLQVNTSACKNLGYTMEEISELTPVDLKPDFTLETFEDAIAPLRRGDEGHIRFQTIHRRKDGSHYDADIVLQQIQSGDQPVFAAIIEDITERKKANRELTAHRDHLQELVDMATEDLKTKAEELRHALGKEKELNKLQRQFVSMASHEFRTPLSIIDMSAQRLMSRANKNQLTPKDAVWRVKKIRDAVRRMTRLMESTLTAARIEEGNIKINVEQCDLRYNVLEVCTRQLELNEEHKIICDLKNLPYSIAGDSEAIDQVFTNLMSNAVKYSPEGTDITVKGWQDGDYAVVTMQDRGLGIDKGDLPQMFSRFFRAGTSVGIVGTGIGLNLVKTLVELHGGTISVESKIGEGSTFTVRLPIAGPDQSEQADTKVA